MSFLVNFGLLVFQALYLSFDDEFELFLASFDLFEFQVCFVFLTPLVLQTLFEFQALR